MANLLEICKGPNINYKSIEKYLIENKKIDIIPAYNHIYNNFINNTSKNPNRLIDTIRVFIKYIDNESVNNLINQINIKSDININNKPIVSSLKSLLIDCNKKLYHNVDNEKIILSYLEAIKLTTNMKRILYYIKKISKYIDKKLLITDYNNIIKSIENILYNAEIIKNNNISPFLILINKCKNIINNPTNELENILLKIDKDIYKYTYFLNNSNNLFNEKDKILLFTSNLNYIKKDFKEIDKLNLKRGFIQGLTSDIPNKSYLLKYQPNKSVMELMLNCYIKSKNMTNKEYFLVPDLFFINEDNSYFYIIEKYNTDLYKYFNILEENNKIMPFKDMLYICKFLMNSISELHTNNIIHSDLKLENIVVNINKNNDISDLKIIDFDVGVFNNIPDMINPVCEKYSKVLNNKKVRGTRIYMLKNKPMSFNSDIYSLGVVLLILLYKNIKLICTYKNKIIKFRALINKLNILRDVIEDNRNKIKVLLAIDNFLRKHRKDIDDLFDNNYDKFKMYRDLILDCINNKYDIKSLLERYGDI